MIIYIQWPQSRLINCIGSDATKLINFIKFEILLKINLIFELFVFFIKFHILHFIFHFHFSFFFEIVFCLIYFFHFDINAIVIK